MHTTRLRAWLLFLGLALGAAPLLLTGCDEPIENDDLGHDAGVADLAKPDLTPIVNNDLGEQD